MISLSRYMVRYKHPYARPAKYSTSTKFVWNNENGGRKEYTCGVYYKNWKHFVDTMKRRHGDNIAVDQNKPYVIYQY